MHFVGFCVCVILITSALSATSVDNDFQSYLVRIKLYLNKEEVPQLIAESIFGNQEALNRHFRFSEVSLTDVIEVLENHKISLKDALKELQFKFDDVYEVFRKFNWKALTNLAADIDISEVYHSFRYKFLKNPKVNLRRILKILNIDVDNFDKAVKFGGPKEIMAVLSTGRYSKRNIEMLLGVLGANISLSDFLKLLKSMHFETIVIKVKNSAPSRDVFNTLRDQVITRNGVVKLMKLLNLTASEFYANEAFATLLKHITDFNAPVIGVAVSSNEILTFMYHDFLKNHTRIVAETFESPTQYEIKQITYERPNVATLKTQEELKMKFVNIPENFESRALKNCTYVTTTEDNLLYSEDFMAELNRYKVLSIIKTPKTLFTLGSPLICGNFLYGVANWDDEKRIEFVPV